MLELKKGIDILSAVGGVSTTDEAKKVFAEKLDSTTLERLSKITNEEALLKIANAIAMCKPDKVMVHTGSAEDQDFVRKYSLEKGEEAPLAMEGHTIHFDLPKEQ